MNNEEKFLKCSGFDESVVSGFDESVVFVPRSSSPLKAGYNEKCDMIAPGTSERGTAPLHCTKG